MTKTYTIQNESNSITVHLITAEAESVPGAERFGTAAALGKLAANWPAARLVEIWNSLPGATPVKKFKDRPTAVSRIWTAIQNLGVGGVVETPRPPAAATPVAPQTPAVAPRKLPAKSDTSRAQKPPATATTKGSRTGSKTEAVLGLLNRPGGASLQEIMKATAWQAHSVRGFISGTLGKKMSLKVLSTKSEDGERSYSIQA